MSIKYFYKAFALKDEIKVSEFKGTCIDTGYQQCSTWFLVNTETGGSRLLGGNEVSASFHESKEEAILYELVTWEELRVESREKGIEDERDPAKRVRMCRDALEVLLLK